MSDEYPETHAGQADNATSASPSEVPEVTTDIVTGNVAIEDTDDADTAVVTPARQAESTGDARVDAALYRLDALDEFPVAEHVAQFDAIHKALQDALTAIDDDSTVTRGA